MKILNSALDTPGYHHRPRLPIDLAMRDHLLMEVIRHDLGLLPHGVIM